MSPRKEYHTVRLPKGWTPARIQRFADSVARLNMATHLAIENAALRRERRALRAALRNVQSLLTPVGGSDSFERRRLREARDSVNEALKPRKARRAGRTK